LSGSIFWDSGGVEKKGEGKSAMADGRRQIGKVKTQMANGKISDQDIKLKTQI